MPFTFFHLGPALAVGLPLRRWLHAPTFIVGNLIVDVEPLAVLMFGLNYPMHGYLHSFLLATAVGLLIGVIMYRVEAPLQLFYRKIQLEPSKPLKLWSFLLAGVFGAVLHVVFDAFLYGAMLPLFPFSGNPFLGAYLSNYSVILVCVGMGIFGLGYYFALFVYGKTKDRTPTL